MVLRWVTLSWSLEERRASTLGREAGQHLREERRKDVFYTFEQKRRKDGFYTFEQKRAECQKGPKDTRMVND